MKRFFLASLAIICLGLGLAVAQNVNKALQLSQDPTGAFGVDTNNNVYFPGHILTTGPTTKPALTTCGTSPSNVGTDTAGVVTEGTGGPTGCLITFNRAYLAAPYCITSLRIATSASPISRAVYTTGIAITHLAGDSAVYDYFCTGSR